MIYHHCYLTPEEQALWDAALGKEPVDPAQQDETLSKEYAESSKQVKIVKREKVLTGRFCEYDGMYCERESCDMCVCK